MTRTDDFNRGNGGLGANWTLTLAGSNQHLLISGNAANGESAFLNGENWSADAFNGDHEAQITKVDASDYVAPGVRMSSTSSGQGYAYFNHGSLQKVVGGANTQISTGTAYSSGQTAKLRMVDDDLSWFIDGALDGTFSDASLGPGGAPGAWTFNNIAQLDNWIGNDSLNGDPPFKMRRPHPLRPRIFAPGRAR